MCGPGVGVAQTVELLQKERAGAGSIPGSLTSLAISGQSMIFDVDPHAPGDQFTADGPFVLDKRHRKSQSSYGHYRIARDPNQVEPFELSAVPRRAKASNYSPHIAINGDQHSFIQYGRYRDKFVTRAAVENVAVKYCFIAFLQKRLRRGAWSTSVK